jgi:positive regulator of sigma E activity
MHEQATVSKVLKNTLQLTINRREACGKCRVCDNFAILKNENAYTLEVDKNIGAEVGDRVAIEVTQKGLLFAFFLVYGIPWLLFLGTLLAGYFMAPLFKIPPEPFALGCGLGGLLLAFLGVRYIDKFAGRSPLVKPRIVKNLTRSGS